LRCHMFKIIWPEEKILTEKQIVSIFQDAIANDDIDIKTTTEKAVKLHEEGLITLHKDWKRYVNGYYCPKCDMVYYNCLCKHRETTCTTIL